MSALLKKIFPFADLKETVARFPLSALCTAGLFVLFVLMSHEIIKEDEMYGRLGLLLGGGYFWFGFTRLAAESRGWNAARHLPLALAGFAGGAALIFITDQWAMHVMFLYPALLLLIMVAPFTREGDDLSFWFFNRMTWFGAAMGVLASLVWAGGLSAALVSIDYLFKVNIDNKIYADIWAFSCCVFGPLYALSWVPNKFRFTVDECKDPPGLAFMLNWVLAPLVAIYMLILYAYLVKILVAGEVPRGQLAYMVTGFGGVGVATYLMGWPLREKGGVLLRAVDKFFFPALIIPVIMQALAAWMRIQQYGVTEERYAIALTVLWFAVISILFAHKRFPLRLIPGLLAGLLLLASFGPWGGVAVSGYSQIYRLETLLVKNNILQDGHVVKAATEVPYEDRKNISSILDYLQHSKRMDKVMPWFALDGTEKVVGFTTADAVKQMGFEYVGSWMPDMQPGFFNFYTKQTEEITRVSGYDYVIGGIYAYPAEGKKWDRTWPADEATGRPEIKAELDNGTLRISVEGAGTAHFDLVKLASEEYKRDPSMTPRDMVLEAQAEDGTLKAQVMLMGLSGEVDTDGGVTKIGNANFRLMVRVGR